MVGDARGRVHSWSVTDVSGRSVADHWLRDDTAETCTKCRVRFSLTERRHHCRNCGHVFCSRYDVYLFYLNRFNVNFELKKQVQPVRVGDYATEDPPSGAGVSGMLRWTENVERRNLLVDWRLFSLNVQINRKNGEKYQVVKWMV